ncbi:MULTISPECIES: hypothetical protein [Martelella]|uniref:Uncharacterized protein n=1 Tax=Martelella radicis TaxID=1397476 RepID=A0A7W6KFJ4_9HYPH|nr:MULTISPECIES: hypothetical protein [Martelella]MBB4120333.1 hypothetical protein [Martelella radicis]
MIDWLSIARRAEFKPRPSLADPLEGEDWRGHLWAAALISRIMRRR